MKSNPVKETLRSGRPAVGTWLSLCSPVASRFLARTGFAWLTVDIEHSAVDWETAATMFGHIADAGNVPLARVPAARHDHVKRVLDNGAWGVVVPMVMSRQEAIESVAATKYPPIGNRSVGGNVHALNFNANAHDYYARANDQILVVLQCEHIEAVRRADEIFSVPGIDAIFVGPNDLRASMRDDQGRDPSPEVFEQTLQEILAACRRAKVAAGIHCFSPESIQQRIAEGWQFLALGSDLQLMLNDAERSLRVLGMEPAGKLAQY
jgi:4-hydroxy-2-oxoheptanedioate aldolase